MVLKALEFLELQISSLARKHLKELLIYGLLKMQFPLKTCLHCFQYFYIQNFIHSCYGQKKSSSDFSLLQSFSHSFECLGICGIRLSKTEWMFLLTPAVCLFGFLFNFSLFLLFMSSYHVIILSLFGLRDLYIYIYIKLIVGLPKFLVSQNVYLGFVKVPG